MTIYQMEPSTSIVGGETAQARSLADAIGSERGFRIFTLQTASRFQTAMIFAIRLKVRVALQNSRAGGRERISNNMPIDDRSFQINYRLFAVRNTNAGKNYATCRSNPQPLGRGAFVLYTSSPI